MLLLGEIDPYEFAHHILEAVAVGIGAGELRGDLGAINRDRHHPQRPEQHGEIEPGKVKDLDDLRIGQDRLEAHGFRVTGTDLHHLGAAVAAGDLHERRAGRDAGLRPSVSVSMAIAAPGWKSGGRSPRWRRVRELAADILMRASSKNRSGGAYHRRTRAKSPFFTDRGSEKLISAWR